MFHARSPAYGKHPEGIASGIAANAKNPLSQNNRLAAIFSLLRKRTLKRSAYTSYCFFRFLFSASPMANAVGGIRIGRDRLPSRQRIGFLLFYVFTRVKLCVARIIYYIKRKLKLQEHFENFFLKALRRPFRRLFCSADRPFPAMPPFCGADSSFPRYAALVIS